MSKVLLTGGSGLLGTELKKHFLCDAPTSSLLDITNPKFPDKRYDLVIHCAAYTDVDLAEDDVKEVFNVNLGGTLNLLYEYSLTPFVYISSEFVFHPVNMYSASKYAGELAVKCLAEKHLIIRTLFKSKPWILDTAWEDQWTEGDYIDVIAPLIVRAIDDWDKVNSKIVHVGTGRKTMYELAKQTKPEVKATSLKDFKGVKRQFDYI